MPAIAPTLAPRFFHIIGARLAQTRAWWTVLLLGLLLSGCSAVRISYNNAPELAYWWLDSYLDFDEAQSLRLRADLTALQAWHRARELPAYLGSLEKVRRLAPTQITPAQVCDLLAELRSHGQTLLDQTEPAVAALAPTLKAEQLDHLARQFAKRNQKWRDEWLAGTPAERSARRLRQLTERTEMLYGRLEEPQRAILRASVASSAFDATVNYREALRRQQDMLQTLRQLQSGNLSELRARSQVRALLVRSMNSPEAGHRSYLEKTSQESCQAFAALHNSITPAQRLQMMETLRDYETDVRSLMAPAR